MTVSGCPVVEAHVRCQRGRRGVTHRVTAVRLLSFRGRLGILRGGGWGEVVNGLRIVGFRWRGEKQHFEGVDLQLRMHLVVFLPSRKFQSALDEDRLPFLERFGTGLGERPPRRHVNEADPLFKATLLVLKGVIDSEAERAERLRQQHRADSVAGRGSRLRVGGEMADEKDAVEVRHIE